MFSEIKRNDPQLNVWNDAQSSLNKFISNIKGSKTDESRTKCARVIKDYVASQHRDMSGETFTKFIGILKDHIAELSNSTVTNDIMASTLIIDELLDLQSTENIIKPRAFAKFVLNGLGSNDFKVVGLAAKTLGNLARVGGAATVDFVESMFINSFDSLQKARNEPRRYESVVTLKELGEKVPNLFYKHVGIFFDTVWIALCDVLPLIRTTAAQSLRSALNIIAVREEARHSRKWYEKIYEEGIAKLSSTNSTHIHGALLALGELLETKNPALNDNMPTTPVQTKRLRDSLTATGGYNAGVEKYIDASKYMKMCAIILKLRNHRSKIIRQAVVDIMPRLASFSPDIFSKDSLSTCMDHLFTVFRKEKSKDRGYIYLALGEISKTISLRIPGAMMPYMDNILLQLKKELTRKGLPCLDALTCVSTLVVDLSRLPIDRIREILDLMLATGLSPILTDAFTQLALHMPSFKPYIQDKIMNMISTVLTGKPYYLVVPSTRRRNIPLDNIQVPRPAPQDIKDKDKTIEFALQTLATFPLPENLLTEFVRIVVVLYLNHESPAIRKAAVETCTSIVIRPSRDVPLRGYLATVIGEVLEQLLIVGIADADPTIRKKVLSCLDSRFDNHLAQIENLRSLFIAMQDEVYEIKELATIIVGRLTQYNPAYTIPALRKNMIRLLTELELNRNPNKQEESARLLTHLIRSSKSLVKPYLSYILNLLVVRLENSPTVRVASHTLTALGELAVVGGVALLPKVGQLIPLIIGMLQDQSSVMKQEVSLRALGQVVGSTGYVIDPLLKYPDLLDILLNKIKTEPVETLRHEAVKLLGILGAVDPYKHKMEQMKQLHLRAEEVSRRKGMEDDGGGRGNDSSVGYSLGSGSDSSMGDATTSTNGDIGDILAGLAPSESGEDYYATIALTSLLKILRDPSLFSHHMMVVEAVMHILRSLEMNSIRFLPQIVPTFLQVMAICAAGLRSYLFTQLKVLVSIVKHKIKRYLKDIFALIDQYWNTTFFPQVISIVSEIAVVLNDEFKIYMPRVVPQILDTLYTDFTPERLSTRKILYALVTFGSTLDNYLHLILPAILRLFEQDDVPSIVRVMAIDALAYLSNKIYFTDFASQILHPIARILALPDPPELRDKALLTLCMLVYQLNGSYRNFVPMMSKVMQRNNIRNGPYESLVAKIVKGIPLLPEDHPIMGINSNDNNSDPEEAGMPPSIHVTSSGGFSSSPSESSSSSTLNGYGQAPPIPASLLNEMEQESKPDTVIETNANKKCNVIESVLQKAWDTSQKNTKEDWIDWISRLSSELLRQSSSPALRYCKDLAQIYQPLANELFNASFVSCWTELEDRVKNDLVKHLERAVNSHSNPPEILQTILNLAEFMEHDHQRITIDPRTLGAVAERCAAYAKALHYREAEFQKDPAAACEALISINNQLGQPSAAVGILSYVKENFDIELKESWYEKLHRWEAALHVYEVKEKQRKSEHTNGMDLALTLGRIRCLNALCEWEELEGLAKEMWYYTNAEVGFEGNLQIQRQLALYGANAAWHLGHWESLEVYASVLPTDTLDGSFFRALIELNKDQFAVAQNIVDSARMLLETELRALVGEGYTRAYKLMVKVQQLTQMEEMIEYKQIKKNAEMNNNSNSLLPINSNPSLNTSRSSDLHHVPDGRCAVIMQSWKKRLQGSRRDVDVWQDLLALSATVRSPIEDLTHWVKFASLCRLAGRFKLAERTLLRLMKNNPDLHFNKNNNNNHLTNNINNNNNLNFLLAEHPSVAFAYIKHIWAVGVDKEDKKKQKEAFTALTNLAKKTSIEGDDPYNLLPRYHLTLGSWMRLLPDRSHAEVLDHFKKTTELTPDWYKAWHAWAMANYEITQLAEIAENTNNSINPLLIRHKAEPHIIPAIRGFFKSVALAQRHNLSSLQDVLRLLTLWFNYALFPDVEKALYEGFNTVSIDTWLQVIPQLIARIHSPVTAVQELLQHLLIRVAEKHPQALVYPLSVATKSPQSARVAAAQKVLDSMGTNSISQTLIGQAFLVSSELIRVAILWEETWHDAIDEAYAYWFKDKDITKMWKILGPLHEKLDKGPETISEADFDQLYGKELREASGCVKKFEKSDKTAHMEKAWTIYSHVFRRLHRKQTEDSDTELELQNVSPKLLCARDLELPVPGTYQANTEIVKIRGFNPTLKIIMSKQRPRKLTCYGSNGKSFVFLLKGHEDLRQDERVMQVFGLLNTLLSKDRKIANNHLRIQQYAIIPLSPNSGLIEWLLNHDTLHDMICDYRENQKIPIKAEYNAMRGIAPAYPSLTVIQKVEVFKEGLNSTPGDDLEKIAWLKSPNSEVWLERRTNYTRSLAVMSMAGYMLGLGDRHLRNIMLDRLTGKITHIDFGDCFEVAIHREKFPERIPFRLTRMLIKAMEVSGVEGNFRSTCEAVIRVMRANRESLMAVLEAFIHDPLINWRLLTPSEVSGHLSPILHDDFDEFDVANVSTTASNRMRQSMQDFSQSCEGEGVVQKKVYNVIRRVRAKLEGSDFSPKNKVVILSVEDQVQHLIDQATSHENLCQCYVGWCPFW